jgi:hypothetical protein
MEVGFQFEIIYQDNDLVEIRVSAWNGVFGGSSDVYVNKGDLQTIAGKLAGFPNSPSDTRDFTLGSFDRESAGGGVHMKFSCIDRSGHAQIEARIESDDKSGRRQSVALSQPIEASAVDSFVTELSGLEKTHAVASLIGTPIHLSSKV